MIVEADRSYGEPTPKYWFARRFPVGHPRSAMAPINREGRMAFVWFMVGMFGGAILWGLLALTGSIPMMILGGVVFIAAAVGSGWWLLAMVVRRGDTKHTVDDYRAGRV